MRTGFLRATRLGSTSRQRWARSSSRSMTESAGPGPRASGPAWASGPGPRPGARAPGARAGSMYKARPGGCSAGTRIRGPWSPVVSPYGLPARGIGATYVPAQRRSRPRQRRGVRALAGPIPSRRREDNLAKHNLHPGGWTLGNGGWRLESVPWRLESGHQTGRPPRFWPECWRLRRKFEKIVLPSGTKCSKITKTWPDQKTGSVNGIR